MSGPDIPGGEASPMPFVEAPQTRSDRYRRVRSLAFGIAVATSLLGATLAFPPAPRLLWNASPSAPMGLYLVSPGDDPLPGDMVIARIPRPWRDLAASRRYIPSNVPLVKRVVGYPGREVCALGNEIFLDGVPLVVRKARDGKGRPMPWWEGCRVLARGEYFLLMTASPDSFDGRYFGISHSSDIIGQAYLLWER